MFNLPAGHDRTVGAALGWGLFLGISWTWCIGMFLPVLMVRELGLWGWIIFAAPNVLGAAAMGWVLRDAQASERIVREHAVACVAFSIVTLAFHLFFIAWIFRLLPGYLAVVPVVAAIGLTLLAERRERGAWHACAVVLLVSLLCAAGLYGAHQLRLVQPLNALSPQLLSLAMVCLLGFLCCPYLDLTFHQARQATTPAVGKAAFTFGFGIVFFAMIVFTLLYVPLLLQGALTTSAAILLGTHLLTQTALKFVLHDRAVASIGEDHRLPRWLARPRWMLFLAAAALPAIVLLQDHTYHGLTLGEIGYRLFLSFYGLFFPAYVWLFIIRPPGAPSNIRRVFIGAVALAVPCYWLGFVEQRLLWLMPGVLVIVCSKVFVRRHLPPATNDPRPLAWKHAAVITVLAASVYILNFGFPRREPPQQVPWRFDFPTAQAESAKTGKPLLIYFTASWCGPCQGLKQTLWSSSSVAGAMQGFVPVELDVDVPANTLEYYRRVGPRVEIPAFVVSDRGKQSGEPVIGALEEGDFLQWLKSHPTTQP